MTTNFPCGRDCIKPFASITLLNLHNSLNEEGVCVSLIDGNVSLDKRVTCPRGIPGWRKHTCQILHKKKKKRNNPGNISKSNYLGCKREEILQENGQENEEEMCLGSVYMQFGINSLGSMEYLKNFPCCSPL